MSATHDKIKSLLPLRQTLESRYKLIFKKEGTEWVTCCPFHTEKTGSFKIKDGKDFFHCFGCGEGGDLFKFVEKNDGIDGSESLKLLADMANVELKDERGNTNNRPTKKKAATAKPTAPISEEPPHPADEDEKTISEDIFDEYCHPLPPSWISRMEKERGWTKEAIDKLDIRFFKQAGIYEKIAVPIRDDEGKLINIRLYSPGAKKFKLLNWTDPECLDCGCKNLVKNDDKEKVCPECNRKAVSYGGSVLWPPPSKWDEGDIWLIEGEPDLIAAVSKGLNATTQTCGAGTWTKHLSRHFRDRNVITAYDNDEAGRKGAHKAGASIIDHALSNQIVIWPDFMANKEDLTDWFMTHGRDAAQLKLLAAEGEAIERPEMGLVVDDELEWQEYLQFFGGKSLSKFYPSKVADELLEQMTLVSDPLFGQTYRWNGKHFEEEHLDHIEKIVDEMLGKESVPSRVANSARLAYLRSLIEKGRELNDHHNLICLKNTMLDIETGKPVKHDPKYLATQMLDYNYDPKAICDKWLDFLKEVIPDDRTRIQLQQFFGYCLTRETRYAKALILKGPGQDGKSIVLKILEAMVGQINCSAVKLSSLEDPFQAATLYNKLLNVATEQDKDYSGSAMFKAIASGDLINAAYKHKDFFQFRPYCKMAFASNFFPQVNDYTHGFYRRWLGIEFIKQFIGDDDDTYLEEKLLKELPGIFLWALAGLDILREQNGFIDSDQGDDFLSDYKKHNNPLLGFVEEMCLVKLDNNALRVAKADIYKAYVGFCTSYGYGKLSLQNFGDQLKSLVSVKDGKTKGDSRKNCYIGIVLLEDDDKYPGDP